MTTAVQYTSNGTFTVPTGVSLFYVSLQGGGAGGQGGESASTTLFGVIYAGAPGRGGNSGAANFDVPITCSAGQVYSIFAGAGGAGGVASANGASNSNGGSGGVTYISLNGASPAFTVSVEGGATGPTGTRAGLNTALPDNFFCPLWGGGSPSEIFSNPVQPFCGRTTQNTATSIARVSSQIPDIYGGAMGAHSWRSDGAFGGNAVAAPGRGDPGVAAANGSGAGGGGGAGTWSSSLTGSLGGVGGSGWVMITY